VTVDQTDVRLLSDELFITVDSMFYYYYYYYTLGSKDPEGWKLS